MAIEHSVGVGGANKFDDVKLVQILINLNLGRLVPLRPLVEDGQGGPGTVAAIKEAQARLGLKGPTIGRVSVPGRLEPNDPLLIVLRDGIPRGFSSDVLSAIMARASSTLIRRYFGPLTSGMSHYNINSPLRQAHFLAQLAHESGQLRYSEELASGAAYEGRKNLGNTEAGDGPRYKGRGLIQITGRANYTAYGKFTGRDYVTPPSNELLATDPMTAVDCSCWYWSSRDLNALADADDARAVTHKINGGYNGLDDRLSKLARAKFMLKC